MTALLIALLTGCVTTPSVMEAPPPGRGMGGVPDSGGDSGTTDSGTTDSGTDSGTTDSGTDSGTTDTGDTGDTDITPQAGRMTGGGDLGTNGNESHHSFTLHCDAADPPNKLQITWDDNTFHLTELTFSLCFDDPSLDPGGPAAPFDTIIGQGVGRLNGVDGSIVTFRFTDDGEPGLSDWGEWVIDGTHSAVGLLGGGNHQAHPDNGDTGMAP